MKNGLPVLSDPTYRIEAELGEGGIGVVYKAWHTRLEKHVVLKRIRDDSQILQTGRMRDEPDILKNLKHANLPQIYDFLIDEGGVYTVMELIPGQSFEELLRAGKRFTQPQIVRWATQLSDALTYLHGQKPPVLHSDIKPGNIMLTPEGNVCLIDFNISLVMDGEAQMAGKSPGYAAPEQYGLPYIQTAPQTGKPNGQTTDICATQLEETVIGNETVLSDANATQLDGGTVLSDESVSGGGLAVAAPPRVTAATTPGSVQMDERSDIYSLGATLCHLATGVKPGAATGEVKRLSAFDLPFSDAFVYILDRCMERDPQNRFQTAAALHEACTNIHKLDGRWKRHRAAGAAAAVIFAALFLGFGAMTYLGWQRLGFEKLDTYNNLVLQIGADETAYDRAQALFPENPSAYRAQALALCRPGEYEECIRFVASATASLSAYPHDEAGLRRIGDMLYIQGNAYFELEDYPNAIAAYEAAAANNPAHAELKNDYAIALARSGYVDRAEALLSEISGMEIGGASLLVLRGEIAYAKGQDAEAIALFKEAIRGMDADNDTGLSRAYLIADKAYRRLPALVQEEIEFLQEAVRALPVQYEAVMQERLADAFVRAGAFEEALRLFEALRHGGGVGFTALQNIGVLYQEMGEWGRARDVYTELREAYPNDYRPPMRLAYLVLLEQAALPNEERVYREAAAMHAEAKALCAAADMEMLRLDSLMAELAEGGWMAE